MPPSPHEPAACGANEITTIGTGPYTADIGDGFENFDTLADVQCAMREGGSGIRSSSEWYRQMRSRHGAKVRDAAGKVVATVSYNARLWRPSGVREEMVVGSRGTASRDSVNERGDAARQLVPDPAAEVHAVVKGRGGQPQLVQRAPHPGVLGAALTLLLPTSRENTCAPSGVSLGVRFGIGAPGPALTERALALTETRPVARC